MDEIDAYRCAKSLIDRHGPFKAWQEAGARAVELIHDEDAVRAWTDILTAIFELTRLERRKGERLQ